MVASQISAGVSSWQHGIFWGAINVTNGTLGCKKIIHGFFNR